MADENKSKQPAGAIVEHLCEHPGCSVWGGFGYMPSKAIPPRWWCARHYPYWPDDVKAKYAALPA